MVRAVLGGQVLGLILALGLSLSLWRLVFDMCPQPNITTQISMGIISCYTTDRAVFRHVKTSAVQSYTARTYRIGNLMTLAIINASFT